MTNTAQGHLVKRIPIRVDPNIGKIIWEGEINSQGLTQLESDVLINGIAGSGFYDCDYDEVWSDCIVDTCKITTKNQISGVVASLVKKGLIETSSTGTSVAIVKFTSQGLKKLDHLQSK